MTKERKSLRRVYGPVASRRFGLSLGLDLVPHKVCTYDCAYCQVGRTTDLTAGTVDFYPVEEVLADLDRALKSGPLPEVITFAGSGEPTLYRSLGKLAREIRRRTDVPLLLITNGSLLHRPEVRAAVRDVDILVPSLDAGNERTWRRLNRPAPGLDFETMVDGLRRVAAEHPGTVRLEVMLVNGVNDDEQNISDLCDILRTIPVKKIDVNTPVRPSPLGRDLRLPPEALEAAARRFGPRAAVVVPRADLAARASEALGALPERILETLRRRPCTARDLAAALSASPHEIAKALALLAQRVRVREGSGDGEPYFVAAP